MRIIDETGREIMAKIIDLTGQKIGRLTVVERGPNTGQGRAQWLCRCACGSEKLVKAENLSGGHTKSCGCLGNEQRRMNANSRSLTPKERKLSPTKRTWEAMIRRCTDPKMPNFHKYGGRGITVCDRWRHSFSDFIADMGEKPDGMSLDRVDNQGHYTAENCRWATPEEQSNNRRGNRFITHEGRTLTVAQWSRETGIKHCTILQRLKKGWEVSRVLHG